MAAVVVVVGLALNPGFDEDTVDVGVVVAVARAVTIGGVVAGDNVTLLVLQEFELELRVSVSPLISE